MNVANDKDVSLEVRAHPFLNFTMISNNKAIFQNDKGNTFGVELINQSDSLSF